VPTLGYHSSHPHRAFSQYSPYTWEQSELFITSCYSQLRPLAQTKA